MGGMVSGTSFVLLPPPPLTTASHDFFSFAHVVKFHLDRTKKWDGKIEPRLLETSSSNLSSSSFSELAGCVESFGGAPPSSSGGSKAVLASKSNIFNYAFLNEDSRVRVYVDLPGVGNCRDEDILLDYTERSLCFTVRNYVPPPAAAKVEVSDELVMDLSSAAPPQDVEEEEEGAGVVSKGEDRCLSFGKLYAEIEKVAYRKKADRVIITLTKKDKKKAWSKVVA